MTRAGSANPTYDANGNETANGAGRTLTYNARNQTTSVTSSSGTTDYTYEGPGQSAVFSDRPDVTLSHSALGLSNRKSDTTSYYWTRDNEGRLIGQRTTGGSRHHYLFDGLGSVVAFVKRDGSIQNSYRYEPFGGFLSASEPVFNRFTFPSGYARQSGRVHFGERYLDTKTGRFTQQDPLNQITRWRHVDLGASRCVIECRLTGVSCPACSGRTRRESDIGGVTP